MENARERRFVVRAARIADCSDVMRIQGNWIERSLDPSQRAFGYMYGEPYTAGQLLIIVARDSLFVVEIDGHVRGFALADDWTDNATTQLYSGLRRDFATKGLLPSQQRVCPRTSAALVDDLHGSGAYRSLIGALQTRMASEFDALMGVVSELSQKTVSHTAIGWCVFAEDEESYYVQLPTRS
jgi:hypothetical protein